MAITPRYGTGFVKKGYWTVINKVSGDYTYDLACADDLIVALKADSYYELGSIKGELTITSSAVDGEENSKGDEIGASSEGECNFVMQQMTNLNVAYLSLMDNQENDVWFIEEDQGFCVNLRDWILKQNLDITGNNVLGMPMTGKQTKASTSQLFTYRHLLPGALAANDWTASTAYAADARVCQTTDDGSIFVCTTAGTSDATEPTWVETQGETTTDGTVTWTCELTA